MKQRIFIAIPLPDNFKNQVKSIQSRLKKFDWPVRWEPPDKWHITLKFLGSISDEALERVEQIVNNAVARLKPFTLKTNGLVVFPSLEVPRVICINVEANELLFDLQNRIAGNIEEQGIGEPQRHPFSGHITIGRLKPVKVNFKALTQMGFNKEFGVSAIQLIKSRLAFEGSSYQIIKQYDI